MKYDVIRSRRRTLALEITKDGRLRVRAPLRTADAAIRAFVHANAWTVFLLGIPGQIAIFLWFRMFRSSNTKKENTNG